MMRRRFAFVLALATGGLGACGANHLGPSFGDSYHAAFDAQIDGRSKAEAPAPQNAEDAKIVMARHHQGPPAAAGGGAAVGGYDMGSSTSAGGGSGASSGSGYGATGNPNPIKLEAK